MYMYMSMHSDNLWYAPALTKDIHVHVHVGMILYWNISDVMYYKHVHVHCTCSYMYIYMKKISHGGVRQASDPWTAVSSLLQVYMYTCTWYTCTCSSLLQGLNTHNLSGTSPATVFFSNITVCSSHIHMNMYMYMYTHSAYVHVHMYSLW